MLGVNKEIDNIDKLYEFLKLELKGYNITTCGISAGGYMATLMGTMLNAIRIISSSGYFNMWNEDIERIPLLNKYRDDHTRNKFYNIVPYIKGHEDNLYYFFPAKSQEDVRQNNSVGEMKIKRFSLNGDKHGVAVQSMCYPYLLTMDKRKIDDLYEKYRGELIDVKKFSREIIPINGRILFYVKWFILKIKKLTMI